MLLSWNEIRHRAIQFAHNWAGTWSEAAEKQIFWNEFFDVFGIQRRLVASFEEPVKRISGQYGRIDLFWKRTLLTLRLRSTSAWCCGVRFLRVPSKEGDRT